MDVYLDGQRQRLVKRACPEEGWIEVIVLDPNYVGKGPGTRVLLDEHGEPQIQRICGKVEIRYKSY
jgi:hypothetical protein